MSVNYFERLRRLYRDGRIDEHGLESAVEKGWLTPEEKERIIRENTNGRR